jgi:hypothetical protein
MTASGKIVDLSRSESDGVGKFTFWLEAADGTRVPVSCGVSERVSAGQMVQVSGSQDSQGTLMADRITPIGGGGRNPWIIPAIVAVVALVAILYFCSSGGTPAPTVAANAVPLVCRGTNQSGGMTFTFNNGGATPANATLSLSFQRSNAKAADLQAGQCGWPAGNYGSKNPSVLVQPTTATGVYFAFKGTALSTLSTTNAQQAWMWDLTDPSLFWTFWVYQSGSQLMVTRAAKGSQQ